MFTGQVFRELDEIRRKQIDLASDHIALESIGDLPYVLLPDTRCSVANLV